jgi:hypothetical protein
MEDDSQDSSLLGYDNVPLVIADTLEKQVASFHEH